MFFRPKTSAAMGGLSALAARRRRLNLEPLEDRCLLSLGGFSILGPQGSSLRPKIPWEFEASEKWLFRFQVQTSMRPAFTSAERRPRSRNILLNHNLRCIRRVPAIWMTVVAREHELPRKASFPAILSGASRVLDRLGTPKRRALCT